MSNAGERVKLRDKEGKRVTEGCHAVENLIFMMLEKC